MTMHTVSAVPDAIFANSRLAEIYDDLEADRCDLDHYVAIAEEFGVRSVPAVLLRRARRGWTACVRGS